MNEFPPLTIDWGPWLSAVAVMALFYAWFGRRIRRSKSKSTTFTREIIVVVVTGCIVWGAWTVVEFRERLCLTQCKNNVKWIAITAHRYHDEHHRFPSPSVVEGDGPPVSWRIDLMSYFDPEATSHFTEKFDRQRSWDDAANLPFAQTRPGPYYCPSSGQPRDSQGRWHTAYAFPTGPGTLFPAEGPLSIRQITDGTSSTLLLVEACGRKIVWTEPRDVDVTELELRINAPGNESGTSNGLISSYHAQAAHVALADGSIRFMSEDISPDVLRALTTADAGDPVNEF